MSRLSREEYFMRIAEATALRSTCPKQSTGAVIVYNRTILATGYNGPPSGWKHCEELGGCILSPGGSCFRSVHAEANALVRTPRNLRQDGVLDGKLQLYSTHRPCHRCFLLATSAGVSMIFYRNFYEDPLMEKLSEDSGVGVQHFPMLMNMNM